MKKLLIMLMIVAMASFLFVGCLGGVVPDVDEDEEEPGPVVPTTEAPIITSISGVSFTSALAQYTNKIEVSGIAPTGSVIRIYVNDVNTGMGYVGLDGLFTGISGTSMATVLDGAKTLYATATEFGLTESAPSTLYEFTLDTTAPKILKAVADAGKKFITVTFDEAVNTSLSDTTSTTLTWAKSAVNDTNWTITHTGFTVADYLAISTKVIRITGTSLVGGDIFSVSCTGISDLLGNAIKATAPSTCIVVPVPAVPVAEVDLTDYNTALAEVAALTETDYTTDSWDLLQLVIAANEVTDQDTQAKIDAATSAIEAAIGNLEVIVNLPVILQTEGNATAGGSTDYAHSGSYSVKLTLPATATVDDAARVVIPAATGTVLNDITSISFWWRSIITDDVLPPYCVIEMDVDGDGEADTWVVSVIHAVDSIAGPVDWTERDLPTDKDEWHVASILSDVSDYLVADQWNPKTLATVKKLTSHVYGTFGSNTILNYKVAIGEGTGYSTTYVDDITINDGVVYDLEP